MEKTKERLTKKENKKEDTKNKFHIDLAEMAQAGLHFGHRSSNLHPKMKPYVFGVRNTIHIINLEKTKEELEKALIFIQKLIAEDKILLLVGTKIQFKNIIKEMGEDLNLPYITERWIGGTLTNFDVMKKRVAYLKELEQKISNPEEIENYTKKERMEIEKKLRNLISKFGGVKNLERIPDAIFVTDLKKDCLAVKEAKQKGVTLIAIVDTNCDPDSVDYPIPANDDAISSVKYILEKMKEVILKAKPTSTKLSE
ncbi:30S ribosomal protein S2 [Patescibacteria group bacterium]|nr:30S ribosomal protein S2 [Patescibacteria group bacterium]